MFCHLHVESESDRHLGDGDGEQMKYDILPDSTVLSPSYWFRFRDREIMSYHARRHSNFKRALLPSKCSKLPSNLILTNPYMGVHIEDQKHNQVQYGNNNEICYHV